MILMMLKDLSLTFYEKNWENYYPNSNHSNNSVYYIQKIKVI